MQPGSFAVNSERSVGRRNHYLWVIVQSIPFSVSFYICVFVVVRESLTKNNPYLYALKTKVLVRRKGERNRGNKKFTNNEECYNRG